MAESTCSKNLTAVDALKILADRDITLFPNDLTQKIFLESLPTDYSPDSADRLPDGFNSGTIVAARKLGATALGVGLVIYKRGRFAPLMLTHKKSQKVEHDKVGLPSETAHFWTSDEVDGIKIEPMVEIIARCIREELGISEGSISIPSSGGFVPIYVSDGNISVYAPLVAVRAEEGTELASLCDGNKHPINSKEIDSVCSMSFEEVFRLGNSRQSTLQALTQFMLFGGKMSAEITKGSGKDAVYDLANFTDKATPGMDARLSKMRKSFT